MTKKKSKPAAHRATSKSSMAVVLEIEGTDGMNGVESNGKLNQVIESSDLVNLSEKLFTDGNGVDNQVTESSDLEPPGSKVSDTVQAHELNGLPANGSGRCYLLEMTAEIRLKIWKDALTVDYPIKPRQLQSKSNKFYHQEKKQSNSIRNLTVVPCEKIVAAQLSLTCHQIYDEVAGTSLLYQLNDFAFDDFKDMLTYLVAITPDRRNAIRSVIIKWSYSRCSKHALTMLSTCEGLRHIKVEHTFANQWLRNQTIKGTLWCYDNLAAIRGLETFDLVDISILPAPLYSSIKTPEDLAALRAAVAVTAQNIRELVTQPRVPVLLKMIREAKEFSGLNIHGDGRLGVDKRPGIVASRTRGQLARQKGLDEAGLEQVKDEHPKFNKIGDLLWDVKVISSSRQVNDNQGSLSIEVLVTWMNQNTPPTWELLDDIVNCDTVLQIAGYYLKHPDSYDAKTAITTIKESMDHDDNRKAALDALTVVLKRNDSPEARAQAKRLARARIFRFR